MLLAHVYFTNTLNMKKFVLLSILFFSIKTFAQTNDGISHKKVYLNVNSKESGIILPDFRNFDVLMKMNSNSIVSTMNDYNYELGATDDINKSFLFTKKSVSFFGHKTGINYYSVFRLKKKRFMRI